MKAQVILIEAQPRRVADGVAETVRLAGGGAFMPYTYGGFNDWRAGVLSLPTLIASLDYTGGDFPAGSVPAAAEIEWAPAKLADLAAIAAYMWFDADITVRIGDEGEVLPRIVISGQVLEAVAGRDGKLRISLADPAAKLKKPLLTSRFAGTGSLEGPVEWQGLIKRRVWGRVWNLRGEPIDKARNIYCYADPTKPLQAIDAVRDKGANAAGLTTLAWQGTAAATFAALQEATAPAGGGVRCPSIACVKWWTQPAGDLCADVKGEVGAGYVETTGSIAQRLVEVAGGPAFAAGTVAAADIARMAPVGWVADSDTTTCASMLDELLGNSSLMWLLDANQQLVIRSWEWGNSVVSATSYAVARQKVLRPVAKRKLGYQRNELKMSRGDLAAIVLTDTSATPPPAIAEGGLWIAPDGHPYRFGVRLWGGVGGAWIGADANPWLASGYSNAQDSNAAGSAKWSGVVDDNGSMPEPNADVTAKAVPRLEPSGVSVTFTANHLGVLDAGQLPKNIQFKRMKGTADVSALTAWTLVSQSAITGGAITVVNGVVNMPAGLAVPASAEVTISSTFEGVTLISKVPVVRLDSRPPSGGGSGTTVSDNMLGSVDSTSMVAISDAMTVRTGASGTITFGGSLLIAALEEPPIGTFGAIARWKWKAVDGAYASVGTANIAAAAPAVVYSEAEPGIRMELDADRVFFSENGAIDVADIMTGLAANTDYIIQLWAARDNPTPNKLITFGGNISATGS